MRLRREELRYLDPVDAVLRRYNAPALYIRDFDPNRRAQSGLGRLYQQITGISAVAAIADPIGLIIGESGGAAVGASVVADGDMSGSSWSGTNWTEGSGVFTHTPGSTSSGGQSVTLSVGTTYRVTFTVLSRTAGTVTPSTFGGTGQAGSAVSTNATHVQFLTAITGNNAFRFIPTTDFDGAIDNVLLEPISGAGAVQATSNSRGTLRVGNAGGRFVWRGDGSDDNLLTPFLPTAAFTMMAAVEFDAVSDKAIGASVSTNLISLGTDSNGLATAYIGSTVQPISAADVRDIPGVIWVGASGAGFQAGWKPFAGSAETVTGTFAGSIPTTQPLRLGAENDDGTAVGFHAGDAYAYLAAQAQFTAGEYLAVATMFSRSLV